MDNSPLPQPHAFTCAHCGRGWDEDGRFCPHCKSFHPTPRNTSGTATGLQFAATVISGVVALFFLVMGEAARNTLGDGFAISLVLVAVLFALVGFRFLRGGIELLSRKTRPK